MVVVMIICTGVLIRHDGIGSECRQGEGCFVSRAVSFKTMYSRIDEKPQARSSPYVTASSPETPGSSRILVPSLRSGDRSKLIAEGQGVQQRPGRHRSTADEPYTGPRLSCKDIRVCTARCTARPIGRPCALSHLLPVAQL